MTPDRLRLPSTPKPRGVSPHSADRSAPAPQPPSAASQEPERGEDIRYCPDGVPPCADCRNGDDLLSSEVCDTCGRLAPTLDMSDCPYFARYAGLPGHDPEGICSYGCRDEPECVTCRPRHGWPSEQGASDG